MRRALSEGSEGNAAGMAVGILLAAQCWPVCQGFAALAIKAAVPRTFSVLPVYLHKPETKR